MIKLKNLKYSKSLVNVLKSKLLFEIQGNVIQYIFARVRNYMG